mgnify:FL=1
MAVEKYEAMIVYSVKESEDAAKALVEKIKALMEKHGTVEGVNEWGKRKLAYDIDYESEGYYAVYDFSSEPDFPAELDRVLNITDGVLRSLIIKK